MGRPAGTVIGLLYWVCLLWAGQGKKKGNSLKRERKETEEEDEDEEVEDDDDDGEDRWQAR